MTYRQRRRDSRPAFTIIELLVVMTIIAILVALLTTAVMNALTKGPELQTSSEIGEMQSKLSAMASSTGVTPLPSQLHLSKLNKYGNTPLDQISKRFLQQRFGKFTCYGSPTAGYFPSPPSQSIDWNGDGAPDEELYLEGEQCLVFLLGGVPFQPGPPVGTGPIAMIGFSSNKQNPALGPVTGEHRDGPFFEFQSNRLAPIKSPGSTGAFPEYLDPWTHTGGNAKRKPYAFFASSILEGGGLYTNDCPSLGVTPYVQSSLAGVTVYVNPSNYQIISAGKDGVFGAGGALWGRSGTTDPNGKDDQSNFSAHLLGMAP